VATPGAQSAVNDCLVYLFTCSFIHLLTYLLIYVFIIYLLTIRVRTIISNSTETVFAKFSGLVELWL